MDQKTYLVVGNKPWSYRIFSEKICNLPGQWRYISSIEELETIPLQEVSPEYVFFLHWSRKVPQAIINRFNCVCFHMTDVPYGRGGSPLQNLILRGHRETKLSALRMVAEFDAGPVYLKEVLSLDGSAEEILMRAMQQAAHMIEAIIKDQPQPVPQEGPVTLFKRRTPAESELRAITSLTALHDFIRMLDADGYPAAFLVQDGFRYEFHRAVLCSGHIEAQVVIKPLESHSL